jgi:ABC-2 type transport system permease protein
VSAFAALLVAASRSAYRSRAAAAVMGALALLFVSTSTVLLHAFALGPALRAPHPDPTAVGHALAHVLYAAGAIVMGLNLDVYTSNNVVREKAQRLLESLLSAPVDLGQLWVARSLAVFLPGLLACGLTSGALLLVLQVTLVGPRVGWVLTPALATDALALVPALYLPLTLLVVLVGLIAHPASANVIGQVVFAALVPTMIQLGARGVLYPGSRAFLLIHLALAALATTAVILLRPRLTKERVVLSCRV